jgi:mono/diheme cytochrome c family protein
MRSLLSVSLSVAVFSACGPAPLTGAEEFGEQVTAGQTLYGAKCASCHGAAGEGGTASKLVGLADGALPKVAKAGSPRTTEFNTAADVATFVVANMPPMGAKLAESEYWSVLAFALKANGVSLDKKLDAAVAATVKLH